VRYRLPAALIATAMLSGVSVQAEQLSIARMFDAPDLSGPRAQNIKFSPDGHMVAFLRGKPDNKDVLDLWAAETSGGESRLLVDSRSLQPQEAQLSSEEAARRERQRTAALRGIVSYQFSPDSRQLLIPLGGDLYLYDLTNKNQPVTQLTHTPAYETDARFSPRGNFVSFIRDQNIVVIDLRNKRETTLTTDGKGLVQNGVAEFVAQEEMDRSTGYWWSPDETRIAYIQIDDSPVQEVDRVEIGASGATVVQQRYPAAGTPNTLLTLKVVDLKSAQSKVLPTGSDRDIYLPRVDWFPDSKHLAVQRESRDQRTLDLLRIDADDGSSKVLLTEKSKSWIELHDALHFLKSRPEFVWASQRSGYQHLYLYDIEGRLIRPLTAGKWTVTDTNVAEGALSVDEKNRRIFFLANAETPIEQHVYSTSLDTKDPAKITRISHEPGWHSARFAPGGKVYVDMWSAPDHPPNASLRDLKGNVTAWLQRNELDSAHPFHPYLADHVAEEFGSVPASDGQALYYRLIKPAHMQAGKRYPVVVSVYGGPGVQTVRREWNPGGYFLQILAQHGFVVFSLDNRGSSLRGTDFESVIQGRLGKYELEDQLQGVAWLRQQPYVDRDRIGVMGWSYGGYMTATALCNAPEVFKAGVVGAPVIDWHLYDTHYTERYLGRPQDNAAGYDASGIIAHASNLKAKMLLVHGMADDNVLFTHSTLLMKALQDEGTQFELMTYPGEKHGLARKPGPGKHYYQMTLDFFERELR
jgi:dipeptidyl-peptidase 4